MRAARGMWALSNVAFAKTLLDCSGRLRVLAGDQRVTANDADSSAITGLATPWRLASVRSLTCTGGAICSQTRHCNRLLMWCQIS